MLLGVSRYCLVCSQKFFSPELIWAPALPGRWCGCFMSSPSNILIFGDCFLLKALSKAQKHRRSLLIFSFLAPVWAFPSLYLVFRTHRPMWGCHLHSQPVSDHRETEQPSQQKVQYLRISNQADYFFVFPLPGGGQSSVVLYIFPTCCHFGSHFSSWAKQELVTGSITLLFTHNLTEPCAGHHLIFTALCLGNWLFWQHFPPSLPTRGSDWSHTSIPWIKV